MLKSKHGLMLIDQWDEGENEKDIQTTLILDYDNEDEDKPIFLELKDTQNNGEEVVGSLCIALSGAQGLALARALLQMIPIPEKITEKAKEKSE